MSDEAISAWQDGVPSLTVRQANERLQQPGAILLDVREVDEYAPRRPAGAINIPMSELEARVAEVPTDETVLVICEHGSRSVAVTRFLRHKGVTQAFNVTGGADRWEREGLPMEHGAGM